MRGGSRSERTKASVIGAAVGVAAAEGLSALSYRKVAKAAGVSTALVTYYFPTKSVLLHSLSTALLAHYSEAIGDTAAQVRAGTRAPDDIVAKLLRNIVTRDRDRALTWAQLLLESGRSEESLDLSRNWDNMLLHLWADLAEAAGKQCSPIAVRTETDMMTGATLFCLALAMDGTMLTRELGGEANGNPGTRHSPSLDLATQKRVSRKSMDTRLRITEAAIDILKEQGPGAICFREISQRAGLSLAAPSYHFNSISELLSSAQARLNERARDRYRSAMTATDRRTLSEPQLLDLTSTIFIREATQSAADNLAMLASWIEAARQPELRPLISTFLHGQVSGWRVSLSGASGRKISRQEGLLASALFLGKLTRIISTGFATSDLAAVREEFQHGFRTILSPDADSFLVQASRTYTRPGPSMR